MAEMQASSSLWTQAAHGWGVASGEVIVKRVHLHLESAVDAE